jgi:carboxypeptidase C (cathepsin A)
VLTVNEYGGQGALKEVRHWMFDGKETGNAALIDDEENFPMRHTRALLALMAGLPLACAVTIAPAFAGTSVPASGDTTEAAPSLFAPRAVKTNGSVTVEGHSIAYHAVAGTILVHPMGWNDAAPPPTGTKAIGTPQGPPVASMFYVAYFKNGAPPTTRPITFLYNGGPGSSTIWLHMGAFGPVRVVTADHTQTPPAPYGLVNNDDSLLDASDLVFIDAPGTGFSRIEGKGTAKAFYGVDPDARAFASFIMQFLSQYDRWNSPKYLYGESYGTPRSAVLINDLESDRIDFNGVILLSMRLGWDFSADDPGRNPGVELPYELALPTMAATTWYHHLLPDEPALPALLQKVEHFALGQYAEALAQGADLSQQEKEAIAEKLHDYTGLSVAYFLKANLKVSGLQFEHELLSKGDLTTGRLDTRFSGPSMDPLGEDAEYDPQGAAISSAYLSAFNDYAHRVLNYRTRLIYIPSSPKVNNAWDWNHRDPDGSQDLPRGTNVAPDLATAMKRDPDLKIMVNGGYFDLATPFFEGMYEMKHLPIPRTLEDNIEYHYYRSGHMVYVNVTALKELHDNVAAFITETDRQH